MKLLCLLKYVRWKDALAFSNQREKTIFIVVQNVVP
jgi:hypothetical protein